MLRILRASMDNKDRGFLGREKCLLHMIKCTSHSATTSSPHHSSVVHPSCISLWYLWTKENFPRRTWKGRNKPTELLSYLLDIDSHLQLRLLYYSSRTPCICLHFILCLCPNPTQHLMVQCSPGHLHLGSPIQRASWLTKWAIGKHELWGALNPVSQYLNMKNLHSFKEGRLTSAFLLRKWFIPGLMKCQGFGKPILPQSAISRHKLTRTIWTLNSYSNYSAYSTLEVSARTAEVIIGRWNTIAGSWFLPPRLLLLCAYFHNDFIGP